VVGKSHLKSGDCLFDIDQRGRKIGVPRGLVIMSCRCFYSKPGGDAGKAAWSLLFRVAKSLPGNDRTEPLYLYRSRRSTCRISPQACLISGIAKAQ